MQPVPIGQRGYRTRARSHRAGAAVATKLVTGAALVALLSGGLTQTVAAQDDDTIVLSAGGSELVVTPGTADAYSAVAEAHAGPGYAETVAAGGNRAIAISGCGAMTDAAAAKAIARVDDGAMTEAEGGAVLSDDDGADESLAASDPEAFAEQLQAEILAENDALQMVAGDGSDGGNDPVRAIASNNKEGREIREVTPENCPDEDKEFIPEEPVFEEPVVEVPVVVEVPSTGSGATVAGLASLFGAASAAAAFGAVALRRREDAVTVTAETRR
jgi:hypothetical protein